MATFLISSGGRPKKAATSDSLQVGVLTGTVLTASTSLQIASGATCTSIDNGDLATGSATLLATQAAIKTYVDARAAATITVADTTDTTSFVVLAESATGDLAPKSDLGITYNASTGMLTATGLTGPLTGNVTGDASGSSGSCTGLAATATALASARTIGGVSFDGTGNITLVSGSIPDNAADTSGNAATATKIASITNSNIVQLTSSQTLTNKTLTAPTLTTPALGTPASGVLTNCTALPAAQVAQGTMASGMVLVAPALGTPVSGVATNLTGTAASLTAGTVSTIAGLAPNTATTQAAQPNITSIGPSDGPLTVGQNLTVTGDLTVSGTTTTISSTTLGVADPLIALATGNNAADAIDIGVYGLYDTSGSQDLYGGLFRDASDSGKWKLFKDNQAEPSTTVNTAGTGYAAATLVADLEGAVTGNVTGNADTVTTNANLTGMVTSVGNAATVVTNANLTGMVTSIGNAATVVTNANLTGMVTSIGNAASLGSFSKAQLSTALSDGTPIYSGDTATAATVATTVTVSDNEATNEANVILFGAGAAGSGNIGVEADGDLTYNPFLGELKVTAITDGDKIVTSTDLGLANSVHIFEAGETIVAGDVISIASDSTDAASYGKAFVADMSNTTETLGHYDSIIGVASADTASGANAKVVCGVGSVVDKPAAQANLVKGKPVFVGADGALLQTAPTSVGQAVIQVGVATATAQWMFTGADIWSVN